MSSPPQQKCNATKQELREDGLKSNDLCLACKKYGVDLEVAYHRDGTPSSSAVAGGNRSGLKRKSLPAPTSGNQWKAHYLKSLDIQILPTDSLATLLGGGIEQQLPAVSAFGHAVLDSCRVITEQSVAAASWRPDPNANDVGTTLLKYLRLIVGTEKMGLESVVDDMVIHLFAALGFNAGRLLILSKNTLQFTMNKDSTCEATADITVYDVANKVRLAVVEDKRDPVKSSPSDLDDNEAQLVAEAIAAAQANSRMQRIEQAKKPRSASVGDVSSAAPDAPSASSPEQPPVLFLVRVVGDQFSFYGTRMSVAFLEGVADYEKLVEPQVTCVYRLATEAQAMQIDSSISGGAAAQVPAIVNLDRWQFKVPAERKVIIEALDRFRQTMLS